MRHLRPLALLTVAALGASGCATAIPPVEVTRFHQFHSGTPINTTSFVIVPDPAADNASLEWRSYAAAVAREMQRLGYVCPDAFGPACLSERADPPGIAHIVTVRVDRAERPADDDGSGVSVGVGGGTGGYRSGVGVGVGLDLTRLLGGRRDVVATRMAVRIARPGAALPDWEGRAETVARVGTPAAQSGLAADKLATALFADFPGRSGETISVP